MPEEPEVDTEKLHEAVHEELEREGSGFLRQIALTTAVLAALASVASLNAGGTVNEALALKTDATRLRTEASDQWAYYQAKGMKAAVQEAARTSWLAVGKEPPPEYQARIKRYEEEQKEIAAQAREKERDAEEKQREAEELLHRHHAFANAVALFQVSIALGAVAALTRNRIVWLASLLMGLAGASVFVWRLVA
jgi:hypothetical protein